MRNAFNGYTYQKHVTLLLLSLMDVERNIVKLDIEAKTDDDFDDLIITITSQNYQLQIKDFEDISINDLKLGNDEIFIKGKSHKLSKNQNIIFCKKIDIKPNEDFLGFQCYRLNENISLVSLSRVQIDNKIDTLYKNNPQRKNEIESFFNSVLDKRIWEIPIELLPRIKIFITELQEKSVSISHQLLRFDNLLLIEGKPGVGKSHFVNTLVKEHQNCLVYRFWIGNQDKDYQDRLKFENFIRDVNSKLFYDQKTRTIDDLLNRLQQEAKTFIIDGLDHVENYNRPHFNHFISFIENAKNYCKILVLSRPLVDEPNWKKYKLENWNLKQTEKVLKALYHLTKYPIVDQIYQISKGYPIIVKYLAEHYKIHRAVPKIEQVDNIEAYYQNIIANEKGKYSLSLFLCCNSYMMNSEIHLFVEDAKNYIEEFIKEHPYLFDIKLHRIALFHDSFNTFLRKQVNYNEEKIERIVCDSILNLEKRFLSRFSFFQLSRKSKKKILIRYASMKTFEAVLRNTVDFEAIRAFYDQLRETLIEFSPDELSILNYYDLSLIFNIVAREHFVTDNKLYYTYVQSLIENGITDEDITSSDFLFGMYYFVKTRNATLLLNRTADNHYDIEYFHKQLEYDVDKEETYISKHGIKLGKAIIDKVLKDKIKFFDNIVHVVENIFIHKSKIKGYKSLTSIFEQYLYGDQYEAIYKLKLFLRKYNVSDNYPTWILSAVTNNLLSYGYKIDNGKNEYQDLTLAELINKHKDLGSFVLYAPSKIVPFLEKNFDQRFLRIEWFLLPPKYINKISKYTFAITQDELFRYNQNTIPFEEIKNVLNSNKFEQFEISLKSWGKKISFVNKQQRQVSKFRDSKLTFEEQIRNDRYDKYKKNSFQRFNDGILTNKDRKFIKKMNLKPNELAKLCDGNHTSISNIDIFDIYSPQQISNGLKEILYNSITSKTKDNYFYSLYYHPGNILTMIKRYGNESDFKAAVISFNHFLRLSMFELNFSNSV